MLQVIKELIVMNYSHIAFRDFDSSSKLGPLAQRNLERNPVISVEPSWRILAIGYQPYVIQPGSVFLQTPKPIF